MSINPNKKTPIKKEKEEDPYTKTLSDEEASALKKKQSELKGGENLSQEDALALEKHLNAKIPEELRVPIVTDLNIEGLLPYGRYGVCTCCNKPNTSRLLICDSCTKHVGFECDCYKHHGKQNCTYNHPTATDVEAPK